MKGKEIKKFLQKINVNKQAGPQKKKRQKK